MHKTMINEHIRYRQLICETIRNLTLEREKNVHIQDVIDELQDFIVDSNPGTKSFDIAYQNKWVERILLCADMENVPVSREKLSWKNIEERVARRNEYNIEGFLQPTTSAEHEIRLTDVDKATISKTLDELVPEKFWILEATKQKAKEQNTTAKSVEEKIKEFGLACSYWHSCQSLIIDVNDPIWKDVFTEEELQEIRDYGGPMLNEIPKELQTKLDEINNLETAMDVYKYGHKLDHDPITQPLLSWLSITLMSTAKHFIKDKSREIGAKHESDNMYNLWDFFNTIFQESGVRILNKKTRNSERMKLSTVDSLENKTIDYSASIDTIYLASNIKLGGIKMDNIDNKNANTKMYLPLGLKDMLVTLGNQSPKIVHDIHILGYHITENMISMLDVDSPKGYITRIRPIKDIPYPTCNDDFVSRIIPLLELAIHGKLLVDKTLKKFRNTKMELGERTKQNITIPSSFIPLRNNNIKRLSTSLSTKPSMSSTTHRISNNYQEAPTMYSAKNTVVKQLSNKRTAITWRTKINHSLLFLANIIYYILVLFMVLTFGLLLYVIYSTLQRTGTLKLSGHEINYMLKQAWVSFSQ
ncbi:hypothetical protein BDC45DRAFT_554510 [Circinella umbellata]|nr:hypothetical protein BDC45DRAFT_554510 [Circinella umbellata]